MLVPRLVRSVFFIGLIASATACSSTRKELPYVEEIGVERAAKDRMLETAADTPIKAEKRGQFLPLAYFPVGEGFRVPAQRVAAPGEVALEMPTSGGQRRQMRRAGQLRFSVKGQSLTLTAFVEASDRQMTRLFVPFRDTTNGIETYPAGRYLDLERTATGLYDLDFNRAYHPYCYYNASYDCPYPPAENRLATPIRAGERVRPH